MHSLHVRLARLRAIKQARSIDRAEANALRGDRRKVEPRVDATAPTAQHDGSVKRLPMDALGIDKPMTAKACGTVVSPSAYKHWLACGRKPHPVFSPDAWQALMYDEHNILRPTGYRYA